MRVAAGSKRCRDRTRAWAGQGTDRMTIPHLPTLDADADAWRLVVGVTTVLLLASVIGRIVKITVAGRQAHAVIDNLNTRIHSWWVMAILVGAALLAGRAAVTLLFGLASLAALREFVASDKPGGSPRAILLVRFLVVLPLQYLLVWTGSYPLYSTFIPLALIGLAPVLGLVSGDLRGFLASTRTLQAGLLICVFSVSHIPALLTLRIGGQDAGRNAYLLVFLLLVVQASDVLQYLWGKLAGRHPIAPKLSSAKTVEGTVGGILSACALGSGLASITPFTLVEAALISLLITLLGFFGGLAMSALKRHRGIKDWGTLIPGHGGMLDRLDSLWLSAPAFFYLLLYGWSTCE
jgi:phosphatidate cytidylyltransferase